MQDLVRTWLLVALAFTAMALSACNTMRGAGQDMGAAGRAVSGTAERATPR
jgi:predicted small secreted protein